jgi:hypothetical protein
MWVWAVVYLLHCHCVEAVGNFSLPKSPSFFSFFYKIFFLKNVTDYRCPHLYGHL